MNGRSENPRITKSTTDAVATARPTTNWWLGGILATLALLLGATAARAQEEYPRIGVSAARDAYVDHITVPFGAEFELYALVAGNTPGAAINQPVSSLPWVIHQVCCGAELEIVDLEFNPELQHVGHPLAGVVSSVETCLDQDLIWLATLTVRMLASSAGDLLWAAGPFGPIRDCNGATPFFLNMPVTITLDGEPTPTAGETWGGLKATYR